MKQIGMILFQYTDDYDELMPPFYYNNYQHPFMQQTLAVYYNGGYYGDYFTNSGGGNVKNSIFGQCPSITPETEFYKKGNNLYNINSAKEFRNKNDANCINVKKHLFF